VNLVKAYDSVKAEGCSNQLLRIGVEKKWRAAEQMSLIGID